MLLRFTDLQHKTQDRKISKHISVRLCPICIQYPGSCNSPISLISILWIFTRTSFSMKITFNMVFFLKRIRQMWQLLIKPTFIFYNFSYTLAGPSSNLYHASWILKHCATENLMINERILKYSKSLTYMNFTDMTFTTRISLALNRFQMNIA